MAASNGRREKETNQFVSYTKTPAAKKGGGVESLQRYLGSVTK
jgi:hypothetical protein